MQGESGLRVLRGSTSPGPEASLANRRPHPRLLGSHGRQRQAGQPDLRPADSVFCSRAWLSETLWQAGGAGGQGRAWGPGNLSLAALKVTLPHLRPPGGAGFLPRLQTLASGASMRPGREEGEGPSWLVGSGDVLRAPPFPHGPVPPLPLASVGNSVHRGPDAGVKLARRESGSGAGDGRLPP